MDDKELFWEWVHKNDVKANGYKIITLSQFKKYVLGLKPEINKKDNFKYLLHFIKEINKKNEK
jgi:hypothetical protein